MGLFWKKGKGWTKEEKKIGQISEDKREKEKRVKNEEVNGQGGKVGKESAPAPCGETERVIVGSMLHGPCITDSVVYPITGSVAEGWQKSTPPL